MRALSANAKRLFEKLLVKHQIHAFHSHSLPPDVRNGKRYRQNHLT